MKLPKLNLAAGRDKLRPNMNNIVICPERRKVYVTDDCMALRHDIDALFELYAEYFTEQLNEPVCITPADWKQLTTEFTWLALRRKEEGAALEVVRKNGGKSLIDLSEPDDSTLRITRIIDSLINRAIEGVESQQDANTQHYFSAEKLLVLRQALSAEKLIALKINRCRNTHLVEGYAGDNSGVYVDRVKCDAILMGIRGEND